MLIYFGTFAIIIIAMFRWPAIAVGALLCTYGLEQWAQSQSSFFFVNQILTNVMTAGIVCLALALRVTKGKSPLFPITREYWVTCGIYLLAFMSVAWSINPEESWVQFGKYFKTGFIFALLMPLAISDKDDLKATLYCVLTLGSAICLMLLLTANWQDRVIVLAEGVSIGAKGMERGNPLAIATMGGQVALVALLMNFKGTARFWQALRWVIVGIGFALTVKSGSRGQTFAFAIAAFTFLAYSRRFKSFSQFLGIVVTSVIFGAILLFVFEKLTSNAAPGMKVEDRWSWTAFREAYEGGRVQTSVILLKRWLSEGPIRWVIGLGSSASFDKSLLEFYCHVVFVEVLAELGIVGWVLLWLFPIHAFQNLKELWTYVKEDPEERGMVAAIGAIFFFEVILSFKQGSLLGSAPAFGLACVLGRVVAGYRAEVARYEALNEGSYPLEEEDLQYELEEGDGYSGMPARS